MVKRCLLWLLVVPGCVVPAPPSSTDTGDSDAPDSDSEPQTVEPTGIRVLILDDGDAGGQVRDALEDGGHEVVDQVDFWRWDGVDPSPQDLDVVVWLQGRRYEDGLIAEADTALRRFYRNGGGVIRTELASFASTLPPEVLIDEDLPVTFDDGRTAGGEWWVIERDHEIAQGIPSKWTEEGTFARVVADEGTTVVIEARDETPLVTIDESGDGVMIHVNHDMTGTTSTISDAILSLMVNCVAYAGD